MTELKRFVFNMVETNCYLLWDDTRQAALIDAGCIRPAERDELKNFIEERQLQLALYLNTHLHFDHVFGNPFVEDALGCKAQAHPADLPWLSDIQRRVAIFGLKYDESPRPLGRELKEGDSLTFGRESIQVLHVPGHSPGSLAFYLPADKMVFTGDALFCRSIGRTDFPDGDYDTLRHSILSKLFALPDDTRVYPGHGPATTIGDEKKFNSYI